MPPGASCPARQQGGPPASRGAQPTSCPAGQLGGPPDPLLRLIVEARSYEPHAPGAGRSAEGAQILCIASLRPKLLLKNVKYPR